MPAGTPGFPHPWDTNIQSHPPCQGQLVVKKGHQLENEIMSNLGPVATELSLTSLMVPLNCALHAGEFKYMFPV
jgi:hypothetical protein